MKELRVLLFQYFWRVWRVKEYCILERKTETYKQLLNGQVFSVNQLHSYAAKPHLHLPLITHLAN